MSTVAPSQIGSWWSRIALSTIQAMISGMVAWTRVATSEPPRAMTASRRCRAQ